MAQPTLENITIEDVRASLARRHHLDFMRQHWQRRDPLIVGRHTDAICGIIDEAMQDFRSGISRYLCIKVPFRHGKSDLVSRYLPPHFIGEFPDEEIIVATYAASLARTFSRFGRGVMRTDAYHGTYPEVKLSESEQSMDVWGIENHTGKVHWSGIGGSITGKGGSLIVVDDFFSGREDAESEVMRDKVWDCITNDILTRCAPVALVMILATPWHSDGVFSRIQKHMSENELFPSFQEIKFPAFSDKYEGGVLFPERFSSVWYESQRALLGPYGTAALLQCDPAVRGGNLFVTDKITLYDHAPEDIAWSRGWDLASSEKQRVSDDPDFTVGLKVGIRWQMSGIAGQSMPIIYIDDMVRGRWTAPKRDAIIKQTAMDDGTIPVGVEAYGPYKDAYENISAALHGIRAVSRIQLPGDKVSKWSLLEPAFAAGNVYMRNADWNADAISELSLVPGSKHDDIADALVAAYATHKPYVKRIFPSFRLSQTVDMDINWGKAQPEASLHYAALCYDTDMSLWFLATLWDAVGGKLYAYAAHHWPSPQPDAVALTLIEVLRLRVHRIDRILGNDRMFGGDTHERSMSRLLADAWRAAKLKQSVSVRDPIHYDLGGTTAEGERLFADNRITISAAIPDVAQQVANWAIENGKPSKVDCGYCECLCLIVSELRRQHVFQEVKKRVDYMKQSTLQRILKSDPMLKRGL